MVKLAASGLCHSDEHLVTGDLPFELPIIGGHEGAGVVTIVGVDHDDPAAVEVRGLRSHESRGASSDVDRCHVLRHPRATRLVAETLRPLPSPSQVWPG